MAPRVNSELLLVGGLPADSADSALRAAAGFFGDLVFALPDGETGPRAAWVGYERERLVRPNPGVVVVQTAPRPCGSTGRWSAPYAARTARERPAAGRGAVPMGCPDG